MLPRRFALVRHVDYTGVSGIGVVAYGVAFTDGQIVLRWCSTHPATSLWSSIDDLLAVHGHGEATSIEWIDAPHGEVGDVPPPKRAGRRAKRRAEEADEKPAESRDAVQAEPASPEPADPTAAPDTTPEAEPEAQPETGPHTGGGVPIIGASERSAAPDQPSEPLAPLPRRPVRVASRGERDPVNGRLSTDTAPLLFDPFGTERDRPAPESPRSAPETTRSEPEPTRSTSAPAPAPEPEPEKPRRPGRHRRPDPGNGAPLIRPRPQHGGNGDAT